jgi:hypothetical protein
MATDSEYVFHRLMTALEDKDSSSVLGAFYNMYQRTSFKPWPDDAKKVEPYKSYIIKSLLTAIRDRKLETGFYLALTDLKEIIFGMYKFGLKWPELETIENSLIIEIKNEYNLIETMHSSMISNPSRTMDNLFNGLNDDPPTLDDTAWYLARLGATEDRFYVNPYRIETVNGKHKKVILWTVLKAIRDSEFDNHEDELLMIKGLRRLGATWPELDGIQKSLENDAQGTLAEAIKKVKPSKRIDEDEMPSEKMKENLKNSFTAMLNNENYQLIANAFERFNVNIHNCPELMRKVIREKRYILHRLDIDFDDERNNFINVGSYIIKNFRLAGLDWPEFITLLEDKKHQLIKRLLKRIADSMNIDQTSRGILFDVNQLKTVVDWPELNIIEKSVKHESHKLNEADYRKADPLNYSRDDKIRFTTNSIKNRELGGVAYYIGEWNMTAAEYPDVLKAFEDNKSKTIAFLLYLVKSFSSDKYEVKDMLKTVTNFIKFGLDWPELRIIHKSLSALNAP